MIEADTNQDKFDTNETNVPVGKGSEVSVKGKFQYS
jgi:hypothetical protein